MHTLEEYANRIGADITGLVDAIRDLAWPMAEDVDVARLQRILEASRASPGIRVDGMDVTTFPLNAYSIDDIPELGYTAGNANTIAATGPTPGPAYEGDTQYEQYEDGFTGPTFSSVDPFQLRISEEVRRIEEAVREEGFPTPDTLVIWVTDDITLVFAPVAHLTHTTLDDDGVPVDYVKEGEPFMGDNSFSPMFGGYGSMDYGIDGRWLSALTPIKTVRGKEAETILESFTPDNSTIPISRLGRGRNPRVFYHSSHHVIGCDTPMGRARQVLSPWEHYGQE